MKGIDVKLLCQINAAAAIDFEQLYKYRGTLLVLVTSPTFNHAATSQRTIIITNVPSKN